MGRYTLIEQPSTQLLCCSNRASDFYDNDEIIQLLLPFQPRPPSSCKPYKFDDHASLGSLFAIIIMIAIGFEHY